MGASASRKPRLSRSADFDRVYRHGRSAQHRLLVLYRFDRPEDPSVRDDGTSGRVGVTVSRKIGSAVVRNKVKRQLRSVIVELKLAPTGVDIVAIARPGLVEAIEANDYAWLRALITELGEKLLGKGSVSITDDEMIAVEDALSHSSTEAPSMDQADSEDLTSGDQAADPSEPDEPAV